MCGWEKGDRVFEDREIVLEEREGFAYAVASERFVSGFGSVEFALGVANCVCIAGGHGLGDGEN